MRDESEWRRLSNAFPTSLLRSAGVCECARPSACASCECAQTIESSLRDEEHCLRRALVKLERCIRRRLTLAETPTALST